MGHSRQILERGNASEYLLDASYMLEMKSGCI